MDGSREQRGNQSIGGDMDKELAKIQEQCDARDPTQEMIGRLCFYIDKLERRIHHLERPRRRPTANPSDLSTR